MKKRLFILLILVLALSLGLCCCASASTKTYTRSQPILESVEIVSNTGKPTRTEGQTVATITYHFYTTQSDETDLFLIAGSSEFPTVSSCSPYGVNARRVTSPTFSFSRGAGSTSVTVSFSGGKYTYTYYRRGVEHASGAFEGVTSAAKSGTFSFSTTIKK